MSTPIVIQGLALGSSLAFPTKADISLFEVTTAVPLGTTVYALATDDYWQLKVSTASPSASVLVVAGSSGLRWIKNNVTGTLTGITAGTGISVTNTDPASPTVSATTGFTSDTFIDLANSTPAQVHAAEFVTSLPTATAGSELAKFLISMATNGQLAGTANSAKWSIEPTTMRTDLGNTSSTAHNWMMRFNGVDVASIGFNSNGQLILTGLGSGSGGILLKTGTAGDQSTTGSVCFMSAAKGIQMSVAPIQEHQANNVVTASTLTVPTAVGTGGNTVNITGSNTVNLIASGNYQNGCKLTLFTVDGTTLKHNQAPSGSDLPMILKGAADIVMAAGARITLVLLGANSGTASVAWYDLTGQVV